MLGGSGLATVLEDPIPEDTVPVDAVLEDTVPEDPVPAELKLLLLLNLFRYQWLLLRNHMYP